MGSKLAAVEPQLHGLVEAIANGLRSGTLQATLDQLEAERADLFAQMAAPAPSRARLHPNLADAERERVSAFGIAVREEATRVEAFEIARSLIDKIRVHDDTGRNREIELVGDIAKIVEISMPGRKTQKKPPLGGRLLLTEQAVR